MITPDQIEVPERMVNAVQDRILWTDPFRVRIILAHALAELANNPVVLTPEMCVEIERAWNTAPDVSGPHQYSVFFVLEAQRRMFLKPEPELPQDVKALIAKMGGGAEAEKLGRKAYEIGLQAGQKVGAK